MVDQLIAGLREYQPRGLASCLRCGHLVRAARIGDAVTLVDPERRAACRWAELLGLGPRRPLSVAHRRGGHRSHCYGLPLGPARPPERLVEVDIDDGLGGGFAWFRVLEDLGPQDQHWRPARHFLRVEIVSGPDFFPGPGDLMVYQIAGEKVWILWPYRIRRHGMAGRVTLGLGVAPPPTPQKTPTRKPKRLRIAGVPFQGLEYLGHQPLYRGWAWRVKPWGQPDNGVGELVAIKRPGESKWRIATEADRIGKGASV